MIRNMSHALEEQMQSVAHCVGAAPLSLPAYSTSSALSTVMICEMLAMRAFGTHVAIALFGAPPLKNMSNWANRSLPVTARLRSK
jgi:hypothetical protein